MPVERRALVLATLLGTVSASCFSAASHGDEDDTDSTSTTHDSSSTDSDQTSDTSSGTGTLTCPTLWVVCDGHCINPNSDPLYCGAKASCTGVDVGERCRPGHVCDEGECRDERQWSPVQVISPQNENLGPISMTVDTSGVVSVAWDQLNGDRWHVWLNRYRPDLSTWQSAEQIDTSAATWTNVSQIKADQEGNLVVLWEQSTATADNKYPNEIWARRYQQEGQTWAAPERVDAALNEEKIGEYRSSVVYDSSGDLLTYWVQRPVDMPDRVPNCVFSNRFSRAQAAWQGPTQVACVEFGIPMMVSAAGRNGRMFTAWESLTAADETQRTRVELATYQPIGAMWDAPAVASDTIGDNASMPQIAVDDNGLATLVWLEGIENQRIKARRYDPQVKSFGNSFLLSNSLEWAERPSLTRLGKGDLLAVWSEKEPTSEKTPPLSKGAARPAEALYNLRFSRYRASLNTWVASTVAEDVNLGASSAFLVLASGASDEAILAWRTTSTESAAIWAARFDATSGMWDSPELVSGDEPVDGFIGDLVVDSQGRATLCWMRFDGEQSSYRCSRFAPHERR